MKLKKKKEAGQWQLAGKERTKMEKEDITYRRKAMANGKLRSVTDNGL